MAPKRPPGELTAGGENNIATASRAAIQLQTKGCGYSYRTHLGTIALKTTDASRAAGWLSILDLCAAAAGRKLDKARRRGAVCGTGTPATGAIARRFP